MVLLCFSAGKLQAQPIRQLQMQKRPAATVQIQNPQKMTGLCRFAIRSVYRIVFKTHFE